MPNKPLAALCSVLVALTLGACETEPDVNDVNMEVPATEPAPASPAGTIEAPEAGAAVSVVQSAEYGTYLADADGRALYLLEADSAGVSTCYDACAVAWPPFRAPNGTPAVADDAVQAQLLGTMRRRDGTIQVTYDGHPLYYYERDVGAGQATGQDVTDEWGEWYLVTPQGTPVEERGGS